MNRKKIINMDNPSEQDQLHAVRNDVYALFYIHNPFESVIIEALKINGRMIRMIDDPSEEMCEIAASQA